MTSRCPPGPQHSIDCTCIGCGMCGAPAGVPCRPNCGRVEEASINHPAHYKAGRVEAIEIIEALGHGHGFCVGNAIKYLWRAGKKSPDVLEDLKKARWYIDRAISSIEKKG